MLRFWQCQITGANLIASGRVPKTIIICFLFTSFMLELVYIKVELLCSLLLYFGSILENAGNGVEATVLLNGLFRNLFVCLVKVF